MVTIYPPMDDFLPDASLILADAQTMAATGIAKTGGTAQYLDIGAIPQQFKVILDATIATTGRIDALIKACPNTAFTGQTFVVGQESWSGSTTGAGRYLLGCNNFVLGTALQYIRLESDIKTDANSTITVVQSYVDLPV